ncbi:MAG: hypothetical protein HY651_04215 [Acidobacteria bacterium]|nr:hypothetical protein [Acidobacteriota bacterium]
MLPRSTPNLARAYATLALNVKAMIDSEWPALREAYQTWFDPTNFDAQGRQRLRLSDLTAPILKQIG